MTIESENSLIAVHGDTHAGARDDNDFYIKHHDQFYDEVFYPTIEQYGITDIFHVGDLLDKRRVINVKTIKSLKEHCLLPALKGGRRWHQNLGNHDIYLKTTRELSAVVELFEAYESLYPNFNIIRNPTELTVKGVPVLVMPWIVPSEEERFGEFLSNVRSKICIGHFELAGFQLMKNVVMKSGMNSDLLSQFDVVLTGHYHIGSMMKNIMYIGSPFQMNFGDTDDTKRFVLFDLKTYDLHIIKNNKHIFRVIHYDNSTDIDEFDYDSLNNVNVKVIVVEKDDPKSFEKFYKRVVEAKPFTNILVDRYVFDRGNDDTVNIDVDKDTLTVLLESANGMENMSNERIGRIQRILHRFYGLATAGN